MHGAAEWRDVNTLALQQHHIEMATGLHGVGGGEPFNVIAWAHQVGLKSDMDSLEGGGGGWTLACGKAGEVSSVTHNITWTLRCKSHSAFSCPAKLKIVLHRATGRVQLMVASGWAHSHVGAVQTSQGVPPSVKAIVDELLATHDRLSFKSLCNILYEQKGVSKALESRLRTYYYRGAGDRRSDAIRRLGVSSYGGVQTWASAHRLEARLAAHVPTDSHSYLDVSGVVGFEVKPEEQRCIVFMSTPKLMLDAWVLTQQGYSAGQLHVDHTFKLFHENIPMLVTGSMRMCLSESKNFGACVG